jgi:hypothetical protein
VVETVELRRGSREDEAGVRRYLDREGGFKKRERQRMRWMPFTLKSK